MMHTNSVKKGRVSLPVSLKRMLLERLPKAEVDPIFSLTYDNENQFFLKAPDEIIWGRIFYQPFCQRYGEMLHKELKRHFQTFKQPVRPCIFFPQLISGNSILADLSERLLCYEYRQTGSLQEGKEFFIGECFPRGESIRSSGLNNEKHHLAPAGASSFIKQVLTRDEIKALIEISLKLKVDF